MIARGAAPSRAASGAALLSLGPGLVLRPNIAAFDPHPSVISERDIGTSQSDVLGREGAGPVLKRLDRSLEFAQALVDLLRQVLSGPGMGKLDLLQLLAQRLKAGLVLLAQRLDRGEHAPQAIGVMVGEVARGLDPLPPLG